MRADDETRTRDPHLGKVMRYQLRYIRMHPATGLSPSLWCVSKHYPQRSPDDKSPGGGENRRKGRGQAPPRNYAAVIPSPPRGPFPGDLRADLRIRPIRAPVCKVLKRTQGPMAQWKSVPFTPERSLVRTQLGPQKRHPLRRNSGREGVSAFRVEV